MKGTVVLATLILALLAGLALFVRPRGDAPTVIVPETRSASAAAERPSRQARPALALPLEIQAEPTTNAPTVTNLFARFRDGDIPRVSREQLEPFLAQNHRSVESLLGALRASGDDALLKEAKEKFPNDPRVQFAAAFKSDSPEERQQWLEKFKGSAPDNALASYLLAGDHFKAGRAEQALQEVAAATAKPAFQNYLLDFVQNSEEAYHAAGYSEAEAKTVGLTTALLPELAPLKQLSLDLVDLAKRYQQAGDPASAREVQNMALSLGQRLDQTAQPTLIQELVGTAIERIVLNSMEPAAPYGNTGLTVKDQMDAIAAGRKEKRALVEKAESVLMTMSDQDLAHFYDRLKVYGEVAAMRWVVNRAPSP